MNAFERVVAENLCRVRERMSAAAKRAGRDPSAIRLVAVTKYAQRPWIESLLSLGVMDLGENRPRQLVERAGWFGTEVRWHLIGPLQRNKVRKLLPCVAMIHSIDSERLLAAIDSEAAAAGRTISGLLEVNISREDQKHGFSPEELPNLFPRLKTSHVRIDGLMGMAAETDDPETARPAFRSLRELRDRLWRDRLSSGGEMLPELSMGMSGDLEPAIEEGATLVRVGSALWTGLDSITS
jgi:pyridoxal phosphate enzyme (YggS family)